MKFQVIHENGLWVTDNEISYFYPYFSQFEASRVDFTSIKIPGITNTVVIKQVEIVYAMEVNAIEDLYWTIHVFPQTGIHVYSDKQLTEYVYTIPAKNKINIKNRSYLEGNYVYQIEPSIHEKDKTISYYVGYDLFHFMFCFKPMIMTPIRNILFGKITNPDGVLVRKTKELYSQVIGVLNLHSLIYIRNKDFSTIPTTQNIARYELINDKGWINVVNSSINNVSIEGYIPSNENVRELQMTIIDFEKTCLIKPEEYDKCIICTNVKPQCVFIHGDTGHSVCCLSCGQHIMTKKMKCPICRQTIEKLIRLF